MLTVTAATPNDTLALGMRCAGLLRRGDIVLLNGRLGSGKTLFTAGIANGLGVEEVVTSPTFLIVRRYSGFLDLTHADVYRLGSKGEFDDLDLIEESADGVLVIEWGAPIAGNVGTDHLTVQISVADDDSRTFTFRPSGVWSERDLGSLAA